MKIIGTCVSCSHKYCARKVSLFENFSEDMLGQVTKLIKRVQIEKGQTLFSEGQAFHKLYIVNGGSLKIFRYNKEGKEQILYILSEGEFIGDINLLKGDIFEFSAVALEDSHICTISKDDFDALIQSYPELTPAIMASAYDRIRSLEELVQTLTIKDVDTRLAKLLIHLSEEFGVRTKAGTEIPLRLTREEMASYIGLTRETISRKLSGFQTDGLIKIIDNQSILIVDDEKLFDLGEL